MIIHYIKIAWRNLLKYKTQSIISILGLAIGFAAFAFTMSWIRYDMGYDKHIYEADRVYKVLKADKKKEGGFNFRLPDAMASYLENLPEVEAVTAIDTDIGRFRANNVTYIENANHMLADTSFFKVFYPDIKIKYPTEIGESSGTYNILSASAAEKAGIKNADVGLFKTELDANLLAIIDGVDSKQTNVPFDEMTVKPIKLDAECPWCYQARSMYIRVKKGVNINILASKIDTLYIEDSWQATMSYKLIPLKDVRIKYPEDKAKIRYNHLRIFVVVSILVILSALFNYLMLFINKIRIRNIELALRKVNGSSNKRLITLLIVEMGIILVISLFLGGLFIELLYNPFITLSEISASKGFMFKESFMYAILLFAFFVLVALVPTYIFMRKSVSEIINPQAKSFVGVKNSFTLTSLFLQFITSILLIFCTIVFLLQFKKLNSNDIGFDRFNIISFSGNISFTKNELLKIPGIEDVIFFDGQFLPRGGHSSFDVKSENGEMINTEMIRIHEPNFIDFFKINILEGRNFHFGEMNAYLINETAKRAYGFKDPIGKSINNHTIIGVIADMYVDSPLMPVIPTTLQLNDYMSDAARLKEDGTYEYIREPLPASMEESESKVHNSFAYKYMPERKEIIEQTITDIFEKDGGRLSRFNNLESVYEEYTKSEYYLLIMLSFMTGVAILISLFGIYSMVTLSCNEKRKEIALRKVNGAQMRDILFLFYRQYLILSVASCIVAFPIGIYVMQQWLEQYTRRIKMEWWLFAGTFVCITLIVLLGVLYRVWKTARENPSEVLKSQ